MRVVHINTIDIGGAATAALRLHQGLLNEKIDSYFLTEYKTKTSVKNILVPDVSTLKYNPNLTLSLKNYFKAKFSFSYSHYLKDAKFKKFCKYISKENQIEIVTFPSSNYCLENIEIIKNADIIHMHWIGDFLDFSSFFRKINKPFVWTLHDENPYKGIFHYENDEIKNRDSLLINANRQVLNLKYDELKKIKNLSICSPSNWLAGKAQLSHVFNGREINIIPNGLNLNIYKNYSKELARDIFGIPIDKKIVLFVAQSIENYRKGFDLLISSINNIKFDNDILIYAIGSVPNNFETVNRIHYLGSLSDERLMALAYAAADVFVLPSREDNLPNTLIESIACGTPVIAFNVGGIKEHVIDYKTGLLAKEVSAQCLADTIIKYFVNVDKFDRKIIRNYALKKFDFNEQANKYIELYERMLNKLS